MNTIDYLQYPIGERGRGEGGRGGGGEGGREERREVNHNTHTHTQWRTWNNCILMGSWYSFDIHCAHCITCCSDHSLGSVETRDNVTLHVYMYSTCTRVHVHVLYTYICCTPFLIWMFVCSYNLKHLTLCTQERMYAYVQRSPHVGLCLDLIHVVRYAFYFPISARLVLHKTRFLTVQSDIGVIAIDHV